MLKSVVLLSLIVKILTQNADNETVGLLLPNLHLSALRARALHDINAARLRHHLPLRRYNLLLETTPEFLRDDLESTGNNANKILNTTQSIIKGIVSRNGDLDPEDVIGRSPSGLEENSKEITSLLKEVFYRILERQHYNSSASLEGTEDNNATISKEGMDFWKIMQENVEPFIKINRDNFTNSEFVPQGFELDRYVPKVDQRTLDYLQGIFSNIVKEELSGLIRKRRNLIDEDEEFVEKKYKKYSNGHRRINDEKLFLESLNHFNRNVNRNAKRLAEENFPEPTVINKQENFFPPHNFKRVGSEEEDDLRQPFIIYAPRNRNHKYFKRSVPFLKLMADPNVKLDMPKTIENIGTVAKNSFEDDKAPMYHIRNMVGSAKNVILAALRIPPQDAVIPTQYKIMDRSDLKKSPDVASRFGNVPEEDGDFIRTFKRIGLMLRESIKSGQETLQHMTDVAHSARKAIVTTGHATPRFLTPYVKATAIKKDERPEKLMLIAPRIGEVTDRDTLPDPTDEYVKIGDLMDAFGVSNPDKKKVGLTRIVMHPKKTGKIQSRFGNDLKKKDFFLVAEHIDDGDDADDSPKGIKDVIRGILKKSKGKDRLEKKKEFLENLFPMKNDDSLNEIPEDLEDVEEILKFDWEKIGVTADEEKAKEVDTKTLRPNQNVNYNELYQKVIKEKN